MYIIDHGFVCVIFVGDFFREFFISLCRGGFKTLKRKIVDFFFFFVHFKIWWSVLFFFVN